MGKLIAAGKSISARGGKQRDVCTRRRLRLSKTKPIEIEEDETRGKRVLFRFPGLLNGARVCGFVSLDTHVLTMHESIHIYL